MTFRSDPHRLANVSLITMPSKKNRRAAQVPKEITITSGAPSILGVGSGRDDTRLPPTQADHVRARLRWVLARHFDDNRAALGRALGKALGKEKGLTGQAITQILNGVNAPGWPIVRGLASYLRLSLDAVLAPFVSPSVEQAILASKSGEPAEGPQDMGDLVLLHPAIEHARYPRLESAIAYYAYDRPAKWSRIVVAAARDGHFAAAGCEQWTPPEWATALDRLEQTIQQSQSAMVTPPKRIGPSTSVPPKKPHKRRDGATK